jgi:hypothetical protein
MVKVLSRNIRAIAEHNTTQSRGIMSAFLIEEVKLGKMEY